VRKCARNRKKIDDGDPFRQAARDWSVAYTIFLTVCGSRLLFAKDDADGRGCGCLTAADLGDQRCNLSIRGLNAVGHYSQDEFNKITRQIGAFAAHAMKTGACQREDGGRTV